VLREAYGQRTDVEEVVDAELPARSVAAMSIEYAPAFFGVQVTVCRPEPTLNVRVKPPLPFARAGG